MSITEKECSRCKLTKDISEFYKSKDTKLGYSSACKPCSREGAKKFRKHIQYTCERCGDTFKRRSDYKKNDNKLCTPCSHKNAGEKAKGKILEKARKGIYVKCENCGEEHYKKRSQLKGQEHYFCSNKCNGEWAAKHHVPERFISSADNRGKNNGRYKHGKRIGGHDRHKGLKKKLVKRDGEGCALCREKDNLHIHRVIPGALGGKYILENTVILCKKHHATVHKDYDKWKSILLKLISKIA